MTKFTKSPLLEEDWNIHKLIMCLHWCYDMLNNQFFEGKLPIPIFGYRLNDNKCSKHFNSDRHLYLNDKNIVVSQWEIVINLNHLELPLWKNLELVLHEMVHHWIVEFGHYDASKKYNCHTVEFRGKLASCGIICNSRGMTLKIKYPFVSFLMSKGIKVNTLKYQKNIPDKQIKRGPELKLKWWACECSNILVEINDFQAVCIKCGREFIRA